MARHGHLLAIVLALAGQFLGAAALPLPDAAPAERPAPAATAAAAPALRTCHCACGEGCCGACCCCSGDTKPADDPPPDEGRSVHWVAAFQVLKCRGHGPAGLVDLPPAVPARVARVTSVDVPAGGTVHPTPSAAVVVAVRPPIPPPRVV